MAESNLDAVKSVLGKPVDLGFSDNALKVRRNLLVFGCITGFISFTGITVNTSSSVVGLYFNGLTEEHVMIALLITNLYHLVHFVWYVVDGYSEWRLRLTGTRVAHKTIAILADENGDYPDDPRQSTLYHWWLSSVNQMGDIKERLMDVSNKFVSLQTEIHDSKPDSNYLGSVQVQLSSIASNLHSLNAQLKSTSDVVRKARVPISLERFDNWYKFFLYSQSLRWILIDCLVPLLIGIYAVIWLIKSLWFCH